MFKKRFVLVLIALAIHLSLSAGLSPDYSDLANWAYYADGEGKVDVFFIAPTVDMGRDGNLNMSLGDEKTKANFLGAVNMEKGIYDDEATFYAPYYRQLTFPLYEKRIAGEGESYKIAYSDVRSSFLKFLSESEDRPFVLAGFSQGAQIGLDLMKELFADENIRKRFVAAYLIGWRILEEDLEGRPYLKMAEGDDDLGVIISFEAEDPDVIDSIIVPGGVKTLGINPLGWTRDCSVASRNLNNGACFTNYDGEIIREIDDFSGAYLDPERGTLKVLDVDPKDWSNSLFPDGVYHLYDYQFFYRNLEKNVQERIERWFDEMI